MILTVSAPGGGGGVGPGPLVADLEPRHPILGLQIALGVAGRQTPGPREADHHVTLEYIMHKNCRGKNLLNEITNREKKPDETCKT